MSLCNSTRRRGLVRRIKKRDGDGCFYCGQELAQTVKNFEEQPPSMLTLDHVVPRSAGGSNGIGNLVLACRACNAAKNATEITLFVETRSGWRSP